MKKIYNEPRIKVIKIEVTCLSAASELDSKESQQEVAPTKEEYNGIFS